MVKIFKNSGFSLIIVLLILIFSYFNQEEIKTEAEKIITLSKSNASSFEKIEEIQYNLDENLANDIELVFCPSVSCEEIYSNSFQDAEKEIKCAFYELDNENLSLTLLEKSKDIPVSLVIEDDYLDEENLKILYDTEVEIFSNKDISTKYMHNKFCIIDDKLILTGSANPTDNGFFKNNNNILKIESKYLAENYENEFEQLKSGIFSTKKESPLKYNDIILIFGKEIYKISSYFCPEDDCDKEVLKILDKAEKEILFASFSFTNNDIEEKYLEKSKEGVSIKGVVEKRSVNIMGSRVKELNETFPIEIDANKYNMHHKFMIIDEKYVITGSMNPTGNGVNYNDENILIIENSKIAKLFKEEFEVLS